MFGAEAGFDQFLTQLKGVAYCGAAAFAAAYGIFFILKKLRGIRVSAEHESTGLDSHEHGISVHSPQKSRLFYKYLGSIMRMIIRC